MRYMEMKFDVTNYIDELLNDLMDRLIEEGKESYWIERGPVEVPKLLGSVAPSN